MFRFSILLGMILCAYTATGSSLLALAKDRTESTSSADTSKNKSFGDKGGVPFWVLDAYVFETPETPVLPRNPYFDFWWDDVCFTISLNYKKDLPYLPDIDINMDGGFTLDPNSNHTSGSINDSEGNSIGGYIVSHRSNGSTVTGAVGDSTASISISSDGTVSAYGNEAPITGSGTEEDPYSCRLSGPIDASSSITMTLSWYPC